MKQNIGYPIDGWSKPAHGWSKPTIHGMGYKCNQAAEETYVDDKLALVIPMWGTADEIDVKHWQRAEAYTNPEPVGTKWGSARRSFNGAGTDPGSAAAWNMPNGRDLMRNPSATGSYSIVMEFVGVLHPSGSTNSGFLVNMFGSATNYQVHFTPSTGEVRIEMTGVVGVSIPDIRNIVPDPTDPVVLTFIWEWTNGFARVWILVNNRIFDFAGLASSVPVASDFSSGNILLGTGNANKETQTVDADWNLCTFWGGAVEDFVFATGAVRTQQYGYLPALDPFWTIRPIDSGVRSLPAEPVFVPTELKLDGPRVRPALAMEARVRPALAMEARVSPALAFTARTRPALEMDARVRAALALRARVRTC